MYGVSSGYDVTPAKLNFWFKVRLTGENGKTQEIALGQGSRMHYMYTYNNWWAGSQYITNTGAYMAIDFNQAARGQAGWSESNIVKFKESDETVDGGLPKPNVFVILPN